MKFYQFLILLSGDKCLNPGLTQYLHDTNDNKFQPFRKRGLHFLHMNVNSLLSKIDELRDIVGLTKPAILGITETKLDSTVSDQEININGYSVLRSEIEIEVAVVLHVTSELIYVLIADTIFQILLKMSFLIYLFRN